MTSLTKVGRLDNKWNPEDTPLQSVFHVSQVHKFSKTTRTLEVLINEQSVRATQKGKLPKNYSAGAFVNIELTSGAGVTVRIHEKNQKQPKKYVFDTTRNRDRFCNLVRGLQKNKCPPKSWFEHFDKDKDGIISQKDLQVVFNDMPEEQSTRLCRGQTIDVAARVMIDWCESSRDRPEWSGIDYYEFVRFVICLSPEFNIEQFITSWIQVALGTSTEVTRTLNRTESVDPRNFLPGEHSWNETTHVSWVFNSENMGLTTIRGTLLCTNYRLIFTAYREASDEDNEGKGSTSGSVGNESGNGGGSSGGSGGNGSNGGSGGSSSSGGSGVSNSNSGNSSNNSSNSGSSSNSSNGNKESQSEHTDANVKTKENPTDAEEDGTSPSSDPAAKTSVQTGSMRAKDRSMGRRRASLIVRDQVKVDMYQKKVCRARLMFVDRVMQVPLLTIQSIKQSKRGGSIRLFCKDIREIKFAFDSSPKWVSGFVTMLEAHIFPNKFEGKLSEKGETKQSTSVNGAVDTIIDDSGTYYAGTFEMCFQVENLYHCVHYTRL